MRIENTKEYTQAGEFVCIKNQKNKTIVRFYFSDYSSDEECLAAAEKMLMLLQVAGAANKLFNQTTIQWV